MGAEKLRVAVLGPLGTYTHEAAFKEFGLEAQYEEQDTITDVFKTLGPEIPLGVVPQENSIFGSVIETYDTLKETPGSFIRGETILKVEHCLLVRKGVKLCDIRRVMSHEQALGQCRDFIARKLPAASSVKMPSTAAAAKALLDSPPDCAAIGSIICATLFEELEILFTNIQNEQSNFTRFFVVAHSRNMKIPPVLKEKWLFKAFIILSVSIDLAGPCTSASSGVMKHLKLLDLFVTRIDRRPASDRIPFNSIYLVEVQQSMDTKSTSNTQMIDTWTRDVENSVSRVNDNGAKASIIGIW